MKMDLLTNATVVDDAIRFVSQKSKDNESIPKNNGQEEETTGQIIAATTNQVF